MADPFNPTTSQNTSPGLFGQSPAFFQNLMNFGASTLAAANQRTADGHLANGAGPWGAIGAGVLGAEQASQQQQQAAAQIQALSLQNQRTALGMPWLQQTLKDFTGGDSSGAQDSTQGGTPSQGASTPPTSAPSISDIDAAITKVESGGNPGAKNSQGYLGGWQAGKAALANDGLYTPAQGEDLNQSPWKGTINIPGYGSMTPDQYQANPDAQSAALQIHTNNLLEQEQKLGLTNYIGQTVGGVPITATSLVAMANIGGVAGTQKFIQSNGQYNPADANGMTMGDYALKVMASVPGNTQGTQDAQSNAPLLPQGLPSPVSAIQRGNAMLERAQQGAMLGYDVSPLVAQAQGYLKYGYDAYAPQILREGGGAVIPGVGVFKMGTFTTLLDRSTGLGVPASENNDITLNGQPLNPASVIPISPGSPGAPGGPSAPAPFPLIGYPAPNAPQGAPDNSSLVAEQSPIIAEYNKARVDDLTEQQQALDSQATNATNSNAMLSQMRSEMPGWTSDQFATKGQDVRNVALGFFDMMGFNDPKSPAYPTYQDLAQSQGNWAAFNKNANGLLLQTARTMGGRIAFQEVQMVGSALPNPNMGSNGLYQMFDELSGMNDFVIAKNAYATKYMQNLGDLSGKQLSESLANGFNVDFNKSISPAAFIFHRMGQTPEGQQQLQYAVENLNKTSQGRNFLAKLQGQISWASQNGIWDAVNDQD